MLRVPGFVSATVVTASLSSTAALAGSFQTLYSFKGGASDLSEPVTPPVFHNGLLYGFTTEGGSTKCQKRGCGGFYSLDPVTGTEVVLDAFKPTSRLGSEHAQAYDSLFYQGRLYTATDNGGSQRQGNIISLTPKGRTHVAYSFSEPNNGGDNRVGAQLAQSGGMLYGSLTFEFTDQFPPSLFTFDPKTDTLTTLYTFPAKPVGFHGLSAPLLIGGTLFGVDFFGGTKHLGRLFSYDMATGVETDLHSFTGGRDGEYPEEITVFRGKVFGVTNLGKSGFYGCLYRYDPQTSSFVILHENQPSDPTVLYSLTAGGNQLYGIGALNGENAGAILSVEPANGNQGVLQTIPGDAEYIIDLTFSNGTLYGATLLGGSSNHGSVFAFTP